MISEFQKFSRNRHQAVQGWKNKNQKKVFGYFCCVTPEEIVFAADMLPVRITGSEEPVQIVDAHIPPNSCPFYRSCVDLGARGVYDYLDGVIAPNTCDTVAQTKYWWETLAPKTMPTIAGIEVCPYVLYINYPEVINSRKVVDYYKAELRKFKQSLERGNRREISDDDLRRAISVYNETKSLLKQLYELRKQDPPPVSGTDVWDIEFAGLHMPKDEYNEMLKKFLAQISSNGGTAKKGVRLYLSGSAMDQVNKRIYEIVEESGGQVVSDDLCVGTRFFWYPINTEIDPLEAIARRSLGTACPRNTVRNYIPENRFAHIKNTLDGYNVKGAVFYVLKCCDARNIEYPHLRDLLQKEYGIPSLYLEGDYTLEGIEQMRGQVEAFVEMLE